MQNDKTPNHITLTARPARETSGNIKWVLSTPPHRLETGSTFFISPNDTKDASLCTLAEIHECWGVYPIISIVTFDDEWEGDGEEILCWIKSRSLALPERLARKAHRGMQHLTFSPLA